MNKTDELWGIAKLSQLIAKNEEDERMKKMLWALAIIGGIIAVAFAAYYLYKFFAPDYMDDFEDEFEDDFEDDFFDDDEDEYDE